MEKIKVKDHKHKAGLIVWIINLIAGFFLFFLAISALIAIHRSRQDSTSMLAAKFNTKIIYKYHIIPMFPDVQEMIQIC